MLNFFRSRISSTSEDSIPWNRDCLALGPWPSFHLSEAPCSVSSGLWVPAPLVFSCSPPWPLTPLPGLWPYYFEAIWDLQAPWLQQSLAMAPPQYLAILGHGPAPRPVETSQAMGSLALLVLAPPGLWAPDPTSRPSWATGSWPLRSHHSWTMDPRSQLWPCFLALAPIPWALATLHHPSSLKP